MANLIYKTRGNSSPQGKARVYFTCHPDDWENSFDMISNAILNLHNCAIWYDSEPQAAFDAADLMSQLSQMQLFVIPVTHRLLTTPSRTMDVEFPFATAAGNHIPVLPILLEPGQDREFEERFGTLQYLDVTAQDVTQISWQEKLEQFLSKILVGDELAEQVRKTFDVYLFLSYRKKDRAQAQNLMRLLHEKEFFRGIGIWYDEYLIPGEDYNASISDALHKSPLFALAVTPNLVNEKNYVAEKEYPQARREKKYVMPFELVPTDQARMYKVFTGICPSIPGDDAETVAAALEEALKALSIRPKAGGDPEREYYLGQAYLSGIDVEVNSEFAVQFLTAAAEAGYLKAMKTLADMYESGNRLPRDSRKAKYWKQRYTEQLQRLYQGSPLSYMDAYSEALLDLGYFCISLGDNAGARDAFEKLTALNESEDAKKRGGLVQRQIEGYSAMMSLAEAERDFKSALGYAQKQMEACRSVVELLKSMDDLYEMIGEKNHESSLDNFKIKLICAMMAVGKFQRMLGLHAEALRSYAGALEKLESDFGEQMMSELRPLLAANLTVQARLYEEQNQTDRAIQCLLRAKPILQDLANEFRKVTDRMKYSDCCQNLAEMYHKNGNRQEAARLCAEAAEPIRELLGRTYNLDTSISLAGTLVSLAMFYEDKLGDRDNARNYYRYTVRYILAASEEMEQTPEILERFHVLLVSCDMFFTLRDKNEQEMRWKKERGHINARRALALGYEYIGDDNLAKKTDKQARRTANVHYMMANQLFSGLAWETRSFYDRYHEGRCAMYWIDTTDSNDDMSLKIYERTVKKCEELLQEDGHRSEYLVLLIGLYHRMANCQSSMKSYEAATNSYLRELNLHRELPADAQTREERLMYAEILIAFADSLDTEQNAEYMEPAVSFREECDAIYEALDADVIRMGALTSQEQFPRVKNLSKLMNLEVRQNNLEEAEKLAKRLTGLCTPDILMADHRANIHGYFYMAYLIILACMEEKRTGRPEDRKACYEKMLPLIEAQYRTGGSEYETIQLADTYIHLAEFESDSAKNRELFTKALKLVEPLLSGHTTEQMWELAASAYMGVAKSLLEADRAERANHFRLGKTKARKDAEEYLTRASNIWKALAKKNPKRKNYSKLADEAQMLLKSR